MRRMRPSGAPITPTNMARKMDAVLARDERAESARQRIEAMLKERKLLFFKRNGLLEDFSSNWVDVGHYTLLLPPAIEKSEYSLKRNRVQLYVDTQEEIVRTEAYPDGMFLVRLGVLFRSVPMTRSPGVQLYATYVAKEDRFYFKLVSYLRSYASKISDEKRNSGKRSAVLLKPKENSHGEQISKEILYNGEMSLSVGDYKTTCDNALYFTESEFIRILDNAKEHTSNYPGNMQLEFKLMKKALTRRYYGHSAL